MVDVRFAKLVVCANAAVPLALIGWDAAQGNLGVNPVELVLRSTGALALVFLALTLAVTPARRLLGLGWLIKVRRALGLISFAYACLHLLIYLILDQGLNPVSVASDVITRPFISFGMLAFAVMVPLAWTSTDAAVRRLGKRWGVIQKRVYAVAVLACAHYWLEVKADKLKPMIVAGVVGLLLLYRLVMRLATRRAAARPAAR